MRLLAQVRHLDRHKRVDARAAAAQAQRVRDVHVQNVGRASLRGRRQGHNDGGVDGVEVGDDDAELAERLGLLLNVSGALDFDRGVDLHARRVERGVDGHEHVAERVLGSA